MDVMKKVPVREQAPDVRNKNFDEVCLGYNAEEAQEEATRCLNCKNARCVQGCPVSINIPEFIHNVKEGNFEEAFCKGGHCLMKPELLLSVDSERRFWLDPRTKLYMLVIFSIVMIDGKTDGISFWLKPILALVPFFLLLSGSRKKVAIIYLIVFVVSWTVNIFLVSYMGLIGTIIISLLAQFGTRWFPSAMMGYYLLSTTKVSEFVLAMQRMHIPEAFIIPFSVMFRFFPTISEEAGSIGNAMRMRGITGKNFFKNPQAVLEYRIVPLMMSVVTIGNDLSAAALTRGLGNGKKRTSICKIGFHWKDFALMIIVTAALLVFLLF